MQKKNFGLKKFIFLFFFGHPTLPISLKIFFLQMHFFFVKNILLCLKCKKKFLAKKKFFGFFFGQPTGPISPKIFFCSINGPFRSLLHRRMKAVKSTV